MKNKKFSSYLTYLILFVVFISASLIFLNTYITWFNIPAMVIPCVILSLASAVMFFKSAKSKKTLIKIISAVFGFVFPNAFVWGLNRFLNSAFDDGSKAAGISFIVLFAVYGIFGIILFLKTSGEAGKTLCRITSVVLALSMLSGIVYSTRFLPVSKNDTEELYNEKVASVNIFENGFDDAFPQTKLYNVIKNHFESELPDGKTEKKCIVIGFDGCRDDVFTYLGTHKTSGVNDILDMNGHAYISYCGGVNYPEENTQDTSTAPGWCSILTGVWADVHGITGNGINKSNEHLTLLTSLVENKIIDSSKFCVSWKGHFSNDDSTYKLEKEYVEKNKIKAEFLCASGDNGTYKNVMNDISSGDCSDFMFCIFEHNDHTGHSTGFATDNKGYQKAFSQNDKFADDIISAVKSRDTFETEDWLFIITSDHGGINTSHGGPSKQERYTFIIMNKEISD